MSENLILLLYKYSISLASCDFNDTYKLIEENYKKYNNLTLNEIYPENDWYRLPNNSGASGYLDLNKYTFFNFNSPNAIFAPVTQPDRNKQFYLVAYKCLKTNAIGYTFERNLSQIIHPFHIVNHNFKLVDVDSRGVNYKCRNCNIDGFKKKGNKSGEIIVAGQYMIYSCDEYLIKNIIE